MATITKSVSHRPALYSFCTALLGQGSQQAASLLITLLAAAQLAAADFGLYMLAVVFFEFAVMLHYTGFFHYMINASPTESKGAETRLISTMFWAMLGQGVLAAAALYVLANPAAAFFDTPDLAVLLKWMAPLHPFAAFIAWASACLMRQGDMARYYRLLILSNLGGLIAGAILLTLWPSVFALLAYRALRIGLGVTLFLSALPWRPRFTFDVICFCRAKRFSAGLYGTRILTFLSNFGTDLILAYLFTTTESGLYRFANRLAAAAIDVLAQPLRVFALKYFSTPRPTRAAKSVAFADFLSTSFVLIGGSAITLTVLGRALIDLMFAPEYMAALLAFYALLARAAFGFFATLIEPVLAVENKNNAGMIFTFLTTAVFLGLTCILAPYGLNAVAFTQCLAGVLSAFSALWVMAKWGDLELAPTLQRLSTAGLLLGAYGGLLAIFWPLIQSVVVVPFGQIAAGGLAAFVLAGLFWQTAKRYGLVTLAIFANPSSARCPT